MPRSRTEIWNYFDEEVSTTPDKEQLVTAKCKYCFAICKLADRSTSGMRSHLTRKHPVQFAALEKKHHVAFDELEQMQQSLETFLLF